VSGSSFAQETNSAPEKTDYKWQMRLRGVGVIPHNRAEIGKIGGDIDVSNNFIPELDFTYFFTENLAAELILGTTRHTVAANNTAVGDLDLGSVYLLPPTLMVQYHHKFGNVFKPYVGAGVNYTIFYNEKSGDAHGIKYDNKFGWGYQFGFDIDITEKFFINVDFKKLFLKTDVTVDASNLNGGQTLDIPAKVKVDPMLIGFGVGMRF
jgi:outer membrane protein